MEWRKRRQGFRGSAFAACTAYGLLLSPLLAEVQVPRVLRPRSPGALAGKTVFLSPGHGFYHHDTLGWITQRGNSNGIVEDFLTAELVCQYLLAYLENAGADVWTVRDRCFSSLEVITDDGDSDYSEAGVWSSTSSGGYGGDGRFATASATETAAATFTPDIPESGHYPLYVRYSSGTNRSRSSLVRVTHAGGTHGIRIDQTRDGYTWRYVGTFWWAKGRGQSVVISNLASGADIGRVVIADAIRIGGGVGSEPPNAGGAPSGRRRADECSVYWARYQGAPASVHDPSGDGDGSDDVTCRPLYAEFEKEDGEDAVYVSVHSNAAGGTGTETYMYLDGTPAGSQSLRDLVQAEVVGDLRAEWDPGWTDRGVKTANFGELRLLSTMPGILTEIAFHDNAADAAAEKEPRWRRIVARGIYHGIARHFQGDGTTLLPEPPVRPRSRVSAGSAVISWDAPPSGPAVGGAGAPASYRVYTSPDGFAFDGGRFAAATTFTAAGLDRGRTYFFCVTAINAGGESFPGPVIAARVPLETEAPRALVVGGYNRLDGSLNLRVDESSALGVVDRQFLDRRLNSGDYLVEHVQSLARTRIDLLIDSAWSSAVEAGLVDLTGYDLVDWSLGREGVADDALNPGERDRLREYLEAGGALLLSGSEIGTDLAAHSSAAARDFFQTWLKASLASEDASGGSARGAGAGSFTSQEPFALHDGAQGLYGVGLPDAYAPLGGSAACLLYGDASQEVAGVQFAGEYRLVHLAFPIEGVLLAGARDLLVERAVALLLEPRNGPPAAMIRTEPPTGEVALAAGSASIGLDGTDSHDGDGGAQGIELRWTKVSGPSGDMIEAPTGWTRARAGLGYGDGDDATLIADMRGAYASIYLVKEMEAPSPGGIQGLLLRVAYDDGFAAYLNGNEVAHRNLPQAAGAPTLALSAVEPLEEVIDLAGFVSSLRPGRNLLAVEVHNASLDSSDLSFSAELAASRAGAVEKLVPAAGSWFLQRGNAPPPADWNAGDFEPTPRRTRVRFSQPGTYRYRLVVDDGEAEESQAEAEVEVTVLPEGGLPSFRRADSNSSGAVDIADAIFTLAWLFAGGAAPSCPDAADANDSGTVDISDPVAALGWLFLGAAEPPLPGPRTCGRDPTGDGLASCIGQPAC